MVAKLKLKKWRNSTYLICSAYPSVSRRLLRQAYTTLQIGATVPCLHDSTGKQDGFLLLHYRWQIVSLVLFLLFGIAMAANKDLFRSIATFQGTPTVELLSLDHEILDSHQLKETKSFDGSALVSNNAIKKIVKYWNKLVIKIGGSETRFQTSLTIQDIIDVIPRQNPEERAWKYVNEGDICRKCGMQGVQDIKDSSCPSQRFIDLMKESDDNHLNENQLLHPCKCPGFIHLRCLVFSFP